MISVAFQILNTVTTAKVWTCDVTSGGVDFI